ncbi:MAG: MBL fold metallo-hydrolase [Gammaproteobacteria bacterium]|nr:MBL fold metallo-hydrolase [Gammaproteobacteria bacterium]
MELGPMDNFIYLIYDHGSGRVAVVDPAWEVDKILSRINQKNVKITDILLTHSHHDHINGVDEVLNHFDAKVHLLKAEAQFWGQAKEASLLHYGGDCIKLGDTEIEVLHTPGHTPGSACYHIGDHLIAGDTLFVFGCGRCDLAGGDANQMFATLRRIKDELPTRTVLYPGHNYAVKSTSTIEEQIEGNPFMNFTEVEKFVHYRMHEHDKIRHSPYQAILR